MSQGRISELIREYFKDDISQFTASILGNDITYRGKVYCWSSGADLVFFNEGLKHLQSVAKSDIIKLDPDEICNECLINTADIRVKLKRTSF